MCTWKSSIQTKQYNAYSLRDLSDTIASDIRIIWFRSGQFLWTRYNPSYQTTVHSDLFFLFLEDFFLPILDVIIICLVNLITLYVWGKYKDDFNYKEESKTRIRIMVKLIHGRQFCACVLKEEFVNNINEI